jgi:hypothetical protein
LQHVTYDNLESLVARDEALIRQQIAIIPKVSPKGSANATVSAAAILPDLDQLLWHLHREDFVCTSIFSRTPAIRGAVYTPPGKPNRRIWAVWMRGFYGGRENPEKNTLHILRFVVEHEGEDEDEGEGDGGGSVSDEELREGMDAILGLARSEAGKWLCAKVEMWNPGRRVREVAEGSEELEATFVVRDGESIASMMMFGADESGPADWIVNEKFAWC